MKGERENRKDAGKILKIDDEGELEDTGLYDQEL